LKKKKKFPKGGKRGLELCLEKGEKGRIDLVVEGRSLFLPEERCLNLPYGQVGELSSHEDAR